MPLRGMTWNKKKKIIAHGGSYSETRILRTPQNHQSWHNPSSVINCDEHSILGKYPCIFYNKCIGCAKTNTKFKKRKALATEIDIMLTH